MNQELNLSQCEKEPIHTPHLIQPHGYVIAFNRSSLQITRVSKNLESTSIRSLTEILNSPLESILPSQVYKSILNKIKNIQSKKETIFNLDLPGFSERSANIILCDAGEELILEIIPNSKDDRSYDSIEFELNEIVRKVITTQEIYFVFDVAATEVKKLTGYDRVMIYQFDEDYNGEVIAEAKESEMQSYLNLHYPASDIPTQARELYLKSMIRIIRDVNYNPVPILNASDDMSLIDMSYSSLRSVSPIHIEYLQNMGVAATMTISIIVNKKLWGLISCHHRKPFYPNLKKQNITEIFGNILGGIIQVREDSEVERKNSELLIRLDTIMDILVRQEKLNDVFDLIQNKIFLFQSIFASDGFLVFTDNRIISHNFPIQENEIKEIINRFKNKLVDNCFSTQHLASILPDLPEYILKICSGLMIIEIATNPRTFWIWRREEKTQTISWGGDPNTKAILNQQGIISPRKSFDKYNQIVNHQSLSWNKAEKELCRYFVPHINRLFEIYESSRQIQTHKERISFMEEQKAKQYEDLIEMLVGLIEQRDKYTAGHTKRVANYSVEIAKELGFDKESISILKEASILHDIGKVIIPDSVLLKPGRLTYREYELIKTHVDVGFQILNRIDYFKPLAEIILYHHEKYDGSGYPGNKKEDEIPMLSHIMIVSDALDAMTTNRIYQSRKTMEAAVGELILYRGKWYHPDVVDATVNVTKRMNMSDIHTTQIPFTQMEKERFSYYFKDQMTELYNSTYLWMVIKGLISGIDYKFFILIEMHGMSEYNSKFGWYQGNLVIQQFAKELLSKAKEEQVFRVYGDDFIICFRTREEQERFISNWSAYKIENVYTTCTPVDKSLFLESLE